MPQTTLSDQTLRDLRTRLKAQQEDFARYYSGESGTRQPVHTVYGGAHLFKSDTTRKLGDLALKALSQYAPNATTFAEAIGIDPGVAEIVYGRVQEKLKREAVEDLRIDFEDGYGIRGDDEEDGHAAQAAQDCAKGLKNGTLSPFIGIRIKSLSGELAARALRTLDIFLTNLGSKLPPNFLVTLPKITSPWQVSTLVSAFEALEPKLGLAKGALKVECMVETTQSILDHDGASTLPEFIDAAKGRMTGAHFGTYDYTASCDITAAYQAMRHPACDFAKHMMKVAYAGTGVFLSDGATTTLPVAPHKGDSLSEEQKRENARAVHAAWRLHADDGPQHRRASRPVFLEGPQQPQGQNSDRVAQDHLEDQGLAARGQPFAHGRVHFDVFEREQIDRLEEVVLPVGERGVVLDPGSDGAELQLSHGPRIE